MHVVQLAVFCKVLDLQGLGYEGVLGPLVQDIRTLEQDGVSIESLGQSVKDPVLFAAADNLAAHGLGGFVQSVRSERVCRFCRAPRDLFQSQEVFCRQHKSNYVEGLRSCVLVPGELTDCTVSDLNDVCPLSA